MKFHVEDDKNKKQVEKREKELAQAEAFLLQKANEQVDELKEVMNKKTRS